MTARLASEQAVVLARAVEGGAFDQEVDGFVFTSGAALRRVEEFLGSRLLPTAVDRARKLLPERYRRGSGGRSSWSVACWAEAERRERGAFNRTRDGRFRKKVRKGGHR